MLFRHARIVQTTQCTDISRDLFQGSTRVCIQYCLLRVPLIIHRSRMICACGLDISKVYGNPLAALSLIILLTNTIRPV